MVGSGRTGKVRKPRNPGEQPNRVKQPQVVRILHLLSIESGEVGKLECEQTRPEPVFGGLTRAEIRRE